MMRLMTVIFCCVAALAGVACKGDGQSAANRQAANANAAAAGQPVDAAKLDSEIAQLEAEVAKNPDDRALRETLADALVKRGQLRYDARRLDDARSDYQAALSHNPDNEEAQTRIAQIDQEMRPEPVAEDGKPVTVPAKPGMENSNQ
jgi:tetratricopeptide (TPR) repeat protein